MTGSSYFFEKVESLQYHLHKVTLKRGSSYIPSLEWINNKKSTINPHNINDNNCFQYSVVAALNHQKHLITLKELIISHLLWITIIGMT